MQPDTEEENDWQNSDWPRRLLHVPTWTCHCWKPGNRYGDHESPSYIAFSYTWGRWTLAPGERPEITSLDVKGIDWELPRINPDTHFSREELEHVLTTITTVPFYPEENSDARLNDDYPPPLIPAGPTIIEYVWIDIICIDQKSASELGRLAKIFQKAFLTYVWLCRHEADTLQSIITDIELNAKQCIQHAGKDDQQLIAEPSWAYSATAAVETLTSDPWFSGLWTLQEAFLCQQSWILSRQGTLATTSGASFPVDLKHLTVACEVLSNTIRSTPAFRRLDEASGLSNAIEKVGLAAIAMDNPIALLPAVRFRRATFQEDYVYGIMQVFGFQLGVSSPGVDPDVHFELPELEHQFGKTLLETFPVLSQLHVHREFKQGIHRWRPNVTSILPEICRKVPHFNTTVIGDLKSHSSLSVEDIDGKLCGSFSGPLVAFSSLEKQWVVGLSSKNSKPKQILALDEHPLLKDLPSRFPHYNIERNHKQIELSRWLVEHVPDLAVLHLGTYSSSGKSRKIGLILAPVSQRSQIWCRLGIVVWKDDDSNVSIERLDGQDVKSNELMAVSTIGWVDSSGYFE